MKKNTVRSEQELAFSGSEEIMLCGQSWSVIWTRHAKNRTYDRHASPCVAAKVLTRVLHALEPFLPELLKEFDSLVTIRVFPYHSCFVVAVNREDKKISVITFGDTGNFTPQFGDRVVSIAENGNLSVTSWKKQIMNGTEESDKKLIGCVAI